MGRSDDAFRCDSAVTEKIGNSIIKIFFDPVMYDVRYTDILALCGDIAEQTAWSVRMISDKKDFGYGVITMECNLAYRFEEESLDEAAKRIIAFLSAHPSLRATV